MDSLERYREMIPQFDRFLAVMACPLPVTVRVNALKSTTLEAEAELQRQSVIYRPMGWYPLGLRLDTDRPGRLLAHHLGHIHVQEEISMVPALVLDPQPGEEVLDMCAAPGGKTAQLCQMMENRGVLVANEPSSNRLVPLRSNLERLGALNVVVTRYDGRRFPHHPFHRILVDAPCSSEGTARRDPGVLKRCSSKRSMDLQRLQVVLLRRAVELTRTGGVIVYSTCTFAPEENEGVVSQVLDLVRLQPVHLSGLRKSPGLVEWEGRVFDEVMTRCARFYPHHNDTGGFFVARMQKT